MATILLPRLPRGTALAVRAVTTAVPVALGVTVAALILLIALFMSEKRQRYALRAAKSIFDLAASISRPQAEEPTPGR